MKYQLESEEMEKLRNFLNRISELPCDIVWQLDKNWDHTPTTDRVAVGLSSDSYAIATKLEQLRDEADELLNLLK